jgi:hypothetical protein
MPTGPMRVSSTHIYWLTASGVKVLAKQGKSPGSVISGMKHFAPNDTLLLAGGPSGVALYELDGRAAVSASTSETKAVAATGRRGLFATGSEVFEVAASAPGTPARRFAAEVSKMAMNAEHIYLVLTNGDLVVRQAKGSYAPLSLPAPGNVAVTDVIAADGVGAFLSNNSVTVASPALSAPLGAPPNVTLGGLGVDALNVYYTVRSDVSAEVRYRARAKLETERTLVDGFADATSIASDGQCVFFWRRRAAAPAGVGEIVGVSAP